MEGDFLTCEMRCIVDGAVQIPDVRESMYENFRTWEMRCIANRLDITKGDAGSTIPVTHDGTGIDYTCNGQSNLNRLVVELGIRLVIGQGGGRVDYA